MQAAGFPDLDSQLVHSEPETKDFVRFFLPYFCRLFFDGETTGADIAKIVILGRNNYVAIRINQPQEFVCYLTFFDLNELDGSHAC